MAQEPKNGRWEAGMNLLFGLVGILLGLLGLSDAPAHETYRLMWPWLVVLFGVAVLLLERLERYASADGNEEADSVEPELQALLADPNAVKVFGEADVARRMSSLPLSSFLRVT